MDNKLRIASMLVAHRYAKNLTQVQVSKKIGVTFQQVQKYERMINKITSDKLIDFCNSLDVKLVKNSVKTDSLDSMESLDKFSLFIFIIERALGDVNVETVL